MNPKMSLIKLLDADYFPDDRGDLVALKSNVIQKNMRHLFISKTKPDSNIPRGNHYHKYKNEWFYIIQGIIKLKTKCLKTKKEEEYIFDDTLKKFINIGPNVAHTFWNIGDNELILLALVDRKFIPTKPDTYHYELKK